MALQASATPLTSRPRHTRLPAWPAHASAAALSNSCITALQSRSRVRCRFTMGPTPSSAGRAQPRKVQGMLPWLRQGLTTGRLGWRQRVDGDAASARSLSPGQGPVPGPIRVHPVPVPRPPLRRPARPRLATAHAGRTLILPRSSDSTAAPGGVACPWRSGRRASLPRRALRLLCCSMPQHAAAVWRKWAGARPREIEIDRG